MDTGASSAMKKADSASYDDVAATFDELSDVYSADIAASLLGLAQIQAGERVIDLGTGTGLVALRVAAANAHVVGIDHSVGMLQQAQKKADRAGLGDCTEFVKMDAESLEFDEGSFDAAVSLFVLLHLPDPLAALKELFRVLRVGGRIAIGIGSGPPPMSRSWVSHSMGRLTDMMPTARGRKLAAPAFMHDLLNDLGIPRPPTIVHHRPPPVKTLLHEAGFTRVRTSWAGSAFTLTAEQFWDVCAVYGSGERVRLALLSEAEVAAVKDEFLRRVQATLARGGQLVYRCGARMYLADKVVEL